MLDSILEQTKAKKSGSGYLGYCPAHEDKKPSLSIGQKDDKILLNCHAGCPTEDILKALGLEYSDLFSDNGQRPTNEPLATYDYVDEDGKLLYQVVRYANKRFMQRQPDGAGGWTWNLQGVERVPYNLPAILKAIKAGVTVYICEGEKDVENLKRIGLTASTNSGGAGKWTNSLSAYFKGANVAILPDNDEPGKKHAEEVANNLLGVAKTVKVIDLPNLEDKEDISDWLKKGHDKEDLLVLVENGVLCTTLYNTPSTQTTEKEKIRLRPWLEVVNDSVEEREWLWEGILPQSGLGILGGWAKEGKSTYGIHLCRAVAQGEPHLGRPTQKAPVVYVNYEMTEDYRSELMAAGILPENAFWLDRPAYVLTTEFVSEIIKQAQSPNGLLVIDTFRGAFQCKGEGENQVGTAGLIVRGLQRLASETGWFILLIHHKNKSGKLSGTGDFWAAADVIMLWKRPNPNEPGSLEIQGRMAPVEPMAISLTLSSAEYLGEAKEILRAEDMSKVLESLTYEPVQASELAEQLNMPSGSIRAYLSKLYQESKVKRSGSGKRGDPYLYSVESVQTVYKGIVHNTQTEEEAKNDDRLTFEETKQMLIDEFDAVEVEDPNIPF